MLLSLPFIAVAAVIAIAIEDLLGTFAPNGLRSALVNSVSGVVQMVFMYLSGPVVAPVLVWLFGTIDSPPIHLRSSGWMLIPSTIVLMSSIDLMDYSFHRLQHKVSWLWAMHSFHHSDETINPTTGYRHYWLDRPLIAFFYFPVGLLFKPDPAVVILASIIGWLLPLYQHLNMKIGFGKLSWLFISPQFHRIHHSLDSRHYDKNFAGFTPLWDVLFGTYFEPDKELYPATGIAEGEPDGVVSALIWPIRSITRSKGRVVPT